ncbi:hypothetical protein M426DRAFT_41592, partial [Hypoxylon sp. CI-4A]
YMKWLRESGGVFWISGKPGSGKSTLMKYLADHAKTRGAIQEWAAPSKAVIASHFFWSSGVSMQHSAQGLFQSLLYDIFRQCPGLIAESCPSRWDNTNFSYAHKQKWKLKELMECFRILQGNRTSTVRFCFFIDGLDEFNGDYVDISQMLAEIAKSPTIKLCVASRPLNEFQDKFGTDMSKTLLIHDFTKRDIMNHARSRLQEHPRWSSLGLDVHEAQSLVEKIAGMASGVFLWVTLVTQSLRNGLTNDDTMEDLNARLDSLPKSLEAFYKQMLDSVDPIYHRKSANLLQMQMAASRIVHALPQMMPWVFALLHEREYTTPDYAIKMPHTTLGDTDVKTLHEQATRRLNAKCRGILEIKGVRMAFIHRSASDYLKTPEMVDYLQARGGEGYNACLSLLRAYVACFNMVVP